MTPSLNVRGLTSVALDVRRLLRRTKSELRTRRKCIAALGHSLLQAGVEPALALLGCAVCKAVRHHPALCAPLQRVVTDRRGGLQRGLDIAGLQQMPTFVRLVRPHAGKAVGLDRKSVV